MSGKTHHCHTPQPHTHFHFLTGHIYTQSVKLVFPQLHVLISRHQVAFCWCIACKKVYCSGYPHCMYPYMLPACMDTYMQAVSRAEQLPTASQSQTLSSQSSWFTHAMLVNVGFIIVSSFTMLCCPSSYGLVTEVLHRTVSMSMLSCLITTQS